MNHKSPAAQIVAHENLVCLDEPVEVDAGLGVMLSFD